MRKGRQIDLRKHVASAIINSRFRRKTPCPQRGSWECWLAGSNRVDLSPPASLRIRNPFTVRRRFPNPGRFDWCLHTCRSSRRPSQSSILRLFPVSLPDASSAVRRRFSFHQFSDWIAPFRRPSAVLSLRITPRLLAFLCLATLFRLERELGVPTGGFESSRSFTASQPPHP